MNTIPIIKKTGAALKWLPVGLALAVFALGVAGTAQAALPVTSGLQLWLDASQLTGLNDGDPVTTWTDMSGLVNDATVSGGSPTYRSGVLNGQPVIRFVRADGDAFTTADLSSQFPSASTVFIVTTINTGTPAYTLVYTSADTGEWWRYNGDGKSYPAVFRSPRVEQYVAMPNSGPQLFAISSSADAWEMWINGTSPGAAAGSYSAGGVHVIGSGSNGGTLDGDIAEVIEFSRALDAIELEQMGSYLADKYGIFTTYPDLTPQAMILSFGVPGSSCSIDQSAKTITLAVPYGYNKASLPAEFTLSAGAACTVNGNPVVSGGLVDFTNPAHYIVKSSDNAKTSDYTVTVTVAPPPPGGTSLSPVCWYDAGDGVITDGGGAIQTWNDRSGFGHHGTASGTTVLAPNQLNSKPAAQLRGGSYLDLAGPFFAKEQYVVVRSPHSANWGGYGAFLGRSSGRGSTYVLANDRPTFWDDQSPLGVSKNGISVPEAQNGNYIFDVAPINEYMVIKITVNDSATSAASYQIGRVDGMSCDLDIAEIIGYGSPLSGADEALVGTYLATKYGLAAYVPFYDILTFGANVTGSSAIITTTGPTTGTIAWTVPPGTDVTTLASDYTVSIYAKGDALYPSGATRDFTLPKTYTITSLDLTPQKTYTVTVTVGAPPPNDNLAVATALSPTNGGTQTGTGNVYATTETGEPDSGATNTVWFKWTAVTDGDYSITTAGSTALGGGEFDAILGIYTGASVDTLTPLGTTPQDTGLAESMTLPVSAGTTYYLQVAGFANAVATNIRLTWSFVALAGPIPVGASGSGLLTFDAQPSPSQWSTVASVPGNSGTAADLAGMDTLANTLAASGITAPLGIAAADPAGVNTLDGKWNSSDKRLTSRAGSTAATCFMATLQNTSGGAINEIDLGFTLTGSGADPELPGYVLYYSLSGDVGSWTRIGIFSTLGLVTAKNIPLSGPWAPSAILYVLWMDDNSSAGDNWYGIDDVSFAKSTPAAKILTFDFGAPYGMASINQDTAQITITVPYGTTPLTFSPTYTTTYGATCPKASGSTQDFSSPVHYLVSSAAPVVQKGYIVTVTVAPFTAEKILNGSFEIGDPAPPAGSGQVQVAAGDTANLPGWTASAGMGWYFKASAWGMIAPDSERLFNIYGDTGVNTLSQSFAVTAGTEYTVSYSEMRRGGGGYMDTTLGVAAGTVTGVNGTPVAVDAGPAASILQTTAVNAAWTLHSFTFTPDTTTTATITFGNHYDSGLGDNDGVFLDNVSVTQAVVTLPAVTITSITGPDGAGKFTIKGTSNTAGTVALLKSTDVAAPKPWGQIDSQGVTANTEFTFTVTPLEGDTRAFFMLKQ